MSTAIKLTKENIALVLASFYTISDWSGFAYALLISAYNGEDWYYVTPDLNQSEPVDYTHQVMTEARLKELYTSADLTKVYYWFGVNRK